MILKGVNVIVIGSQRKKRKASQRNEMVKGIMDEKFPNLMSH
jgi:hypothetical protein